MNPNVLIAVAVLALTGACAGASEAPRAPSAVATTELPQVYAVRGNVADVARSEQFYRAALGAPQVSVVHEGEIVVRFAAGPVVVLTENRRGAALPNGAAGFILRVADLEAATARAAAGGGTLVRPPNSGEEPNSHGVRSSLVTDPDGIAIELIQLPPG